MKVCLQYYRASKVWLMTVNDTVIQINRNQALALIEGDVDFYIED